MVQTRGLVLFLWSQRDLNLRTGSLRNLSRFQVSILLFLLITLRRSGWILLWSCHLGNTLTTYVA